MNKDFLFQGKSVRRYMDNSMLRLLYDPILLTMKITVLLIIVFSLQASASTYGQRINISYKNTSLATVIKAISLQGDVDFVYKDQYLEKANLVTINLRNLPVAEALKVVFHNQPFVYDIADGIVYITPKNKEVQKKEDVSRQAFIRGRIVDERGRALAGAGLIVKSTQKKRLRMRTANFTFWV